MQGQGSSVPSGDLFLKIIHGEKWATEFPPYPGDPSHKEIAHWSLPRADLSPEVNQWRVANFRRFSQGWVRLAVARMAQRVHGMPFIYGALWLRVFRGDGTIDDLGLASLRVVTTAGVTYLAADMAAGANDINLFKFHGFGTGGTAEASGDTALVTEETTQYNPDNTRPTGSQSSSTNTYTTVATYSPDSGATRAITEHGIFTQAATGGGTLWDRTLFSVVNLVAASDSLQATYVATFPAGS
jgi:hypothetical protein